MYLNPRHKGGNAAHKKLKSEDAELLAFQQLIIRLHEQCVQGLEMTQSTDATDFEIIKVIRDQMRSKQMRQGRKQKQMEPNIVEPKKDETRNPKPLRRMKMKQNQILVFHRCQIMTQFMHQ